MMRILRKIFVSFYLIPPHCLQKKKSKYPTTAPGHQNNFGSSNSGYITDILRCRFMVIQKHFTDDLRHRTHTTENCGPFLTVNFHSIIKPKLTWYINDLQFTASCTDMKINIGNIFILQFRIYVSSRKILMPQGKEV